MSRQLVADNGVDVISVDWQLRDLNTADGSASVDWGDRRLLNSSGLWSVDWEGQTLFSSSWLVLDWFNSTLQSNDGTLDTISLDWYNRQLRIGATVPAEWGTGAFKVASYTVAGVPSAVTCGAGSQIFVTNEAGGAVLAFSDGANWLRCTDRAVIS